MLTSLSLRGFKAWEAAELEFGSITGLFGANSSGKTSLVQFLLLLKQTKDTTDRALALDFGGRNSLVDLGGYRDVVHGHQEGSPIRWTLGWSLPSILRISDPAGPKGATIFEGDQIRVSAGVAPRKGTLESTGLSYRFSGAGFSLEPRRGDSARFDLTATDVSDPGDTAFRFARNQGRPWQLPGPVKSYAFPDQARTYFRNADFLSEFELAYEHQMDNIYYLGPLREYPQRQYTWSGSRPTDVGQRGEKVIDALLAARTRGDRLNLKHRGRLRPFEGIIGHWLKQLGLIHLFEVKEVADNTNLYQAWVQRTKASPRALITDVGFGVSQVLPVLVLLYYVPERSTVILEQPEIHLHPSVQSGLADVIVNVATHRNVQVIVESHSEYLLRRLQRRIAEAQLAPEVTQLYFCRPVGGKSVLEPLKTNMYGSIENWPEDFFGDPFGETVAIREAALRRRIGDRG